MVEWLKRWAAGRGMIFGKKSITPGVVSGVVDALKNSNKKIVRTAEEFIRGLESQDLIDRLCEIWRNTRDPKLEDLIAEKSYVASGPLNLHVLTKLKSGEVFNISDGPCLRLVADLIDDANEMVRTKAAESLAEIKDHEIRDELCELAILKPGSKVAVFSLGKHIYPSNEGKRALFFFVNNKLDLFFTVDNALDVLRRQYDQSAALIRAHVMAVVRLGDTRCLRFFTQRKRLFQCDADEIKATIDSTVQIHEWSVLWQYVLELPLRMSLPILYCLKDAKKNGWEPQTPRDKRTLETLIGFLRDIPENSVVIDFPETLPKPDWRLFDQWLDDGRSSGAYTRLSTDQIVLELQRAIPPESVKIVGAMAAHGHWNSEQFSTAIENHSHWFTRLAGYRTNLIPLFKSETIDDPLNRVRDLASDRSIMGFWPIEVKSEDLNSLRRRTEKAKGNDKKEQSLLRILQSLCQYHLDFMGDVQEVVKEFPGENFGEFRPV